MQIGTGTGEVAGGGAYELTFGNLPHGTLYQSPYGIDGKSVIDMRSGVLGKAFMSGMNRYMNVEAKTQTISGQTALTGISAGIPTVPVFLDPRVVDITRKYTPLVEIMPRMTCTSNVYSYLQITGKGGAYTAAEGAALPETNTTYVRSSVAVKYLYSVGAVTGPLMAAQPSFILEGMMPTGERGPFGNQNAPNAKQQEVLVKVRALRELEENLIINGNATVTPTEFDGIIQIMGATNTVNKGGAALTLDDITDSIQKAFDAGGRPNLAVCGSSVFGDMLKLLAGKIGFMQPMQQVFWGFETIVLHTMVGQVTVVPSMFLANTAGSKAMYFLDMTVCHMAVLQDMLYFDIKTQNDTDKFALKLYEALVIRAPTFNSSITNIA